MPKIKDCPTCGRFDCFAHKDGHCVVLTDTTFKEKECPFHKTNDQVKEEKEYCQQRLAQKETED